MDSRNLFRAGVCVITLGAWLSLGGCGWLRSEVKPDPAHADRPRVAVLPFDMGIEITSLSSIQSVNGAT